MRTGGSAPHLVRWFDHMAALPACAAALEELAASKGGKGGAAGAAAAGGDAAASKMKGGGGEFAVFDLAVLTACARLLSPHHILSRSKRRHSPLPLPPHTHTPQQQTPDTGSFDVGLPNAVHGKVVTRFPPEPSGYLHVGHAKAALLNQHFAKMYGGKLLVRFDDTNPSKEKDEFVENILKDTRDLGLEWEATTYTSDYFPQMLDLAVRMIKAGLMYADDTPVEQMREERMHGVESKRRGRPAEESLRLFQEMQSGSEEGLRHCIRYRMDMQNPNKALRDPVCFRCNLTPHWRTGEKYKVGGAWFCFVVWTALACSCTLDCCLAMHAWLLVHGGRRGASGERRE